MQRSTFTWITFSRSSVVWLLVVWVYQWNTLHNFRKMPKTLNQTMISSLEYMTKTYCSRCFNVTTQLYRRGWHADEEIHVACHSCWITRIISHHLVAARQFNLHTPICFSLISVAVEHLLSSCDMRLNSAPSSSSLRPSASFIALKTHTYHRE